MPDDTTTAKLRQGTRVVGRNGLGGEVEQVIGDRAIVRLDGGERVLLSADSFTAGDGGRADVDFSPDDVEHARQHHEHHRAALSASGQLNDDKQGEVHAVIPLIEERVRAGKRVVETGRVKVRKIVREEQEEIEQTLARRDVRVERVPVDRPVEDADNPPRSRREGDVLIIPLLEERIVVEKRLVLREELHITEINTAEPHKQTVTVRREEAAVERTPADEAGR